MGQGQEESIERCAAKRRAALVLRVPKGATSVADAARQHDLTVAEAWQDQFLSGGMISGEHYMEVLAQPSGAKASW